MSSNSKIITPRKRDRRKADNQNIRFPLYLESEIIEKDRRQYQDRRALGYISEQKLFKGVDWEYVEPLLSPCPIISLKSGEILLSPDTNNDKLYLVRSGRLKITFDLLNSEAESWFIESGDFVGDMSIIDETRPCAYILADGACEVVAVHQDIFWTCISHDVSVSRNMLKIFVERIRQTNQLALIAQEERLRFQHLQKELQAAKDIQLSILPCMPLYQNVNKVRIYGIMNSAKDVGGDFFDVQLINNRYLYISIGDVSGKGMPAALFMVRTITMLRDTISRTNSKLDKIISHVNNTLCENNHTNMFATLFVACIDLEDGSLEYINAGHNPVYIGNQTNGYRFLQESSGILVGIMNNTPYVSATTQMQNGETIFLYTDGVTEAENSNKNLFGDTRLKKILLTLADTDPVELINGISNAITDFVGDTPQSDDITMLAVHYQI